MDPTALIVLVLGLGGVAVASIYYYIWKMGKLGMRITDTDDATERGYAKVEAVSEGPAAAAGVMDGDLIVSVGGVAVKGRAEATAAITKANGLLSMEIARRKSRMRGSTRGSR